MIIYHQKSRLYLLTRDYGGRRLLKSKIIESPLVYTLDHNDLTIIIVIYNSTKSQDSYKYLFIISEFK